jgi:hypothetical protein
VQPLRRARDMLGLRDGHEIPQLLQLHCYVLYCIIYDQLSLGRHYIQPISFQLNSLHRHCHGGARWLKDKMAAGAGAATVIGHA